LVVSDCDSAVTILIAALDSILTEYC
jgi:hypothetical protein